VASTSHIVLIPSYNTGRLLRPTVDAASAAWDPVWVVIDGSTDDSPASLRPDTNRLVRPSNGGKGAAVLDGLEHAHAEGFTHALVMDADGQHPAALIADFMAASAANPAAMILGVPRFGPDAPALRVHGRKISNFWARLETGGAIADSLFGFRVYPVAPLLGIMRRSRHMRGYDFDVEAAVRLCWAGIQAINRPAPVHYPARDQGGVSHFRYARDNARLAAMHARLVVAAIKRT